jgi:hypothetical protein
LRSFTRLAVLQRRKSAQFTAGPAVHSSAALPEGMTDDDVARLVRRGEPVRRQRGT